MIKEEILFEGPDKLMIVAHPDDESLWAGCELLKCGYLVVCVTNGRHKVRAGEFRRAVEISGNQGIILGYRDIKFLAWGRKTPALERELADIINGKDWKKIVTHNLEGEYGHLHHKVLHRMVTALCQKKGCADRLYYFGKFYTKEALAKKLYSPPPLDDGLYQKKRELLDVYKSQRKSMGRYGHSARYEYIPDENEYARAAAVADPEE